MTVAAQNGTNPPMVLASLNRRINTLQRRTRFFYTLSGFGIALVLAESGCSSDSGDDTEALDPPLLEIKGAQNAAGNTFDRDDDVIEVACDPRVTIRLGPSSLGAGLLDNWKFRGPANCKEADQCGYVRVELRGDDEKVLSTLEQAVLNPVIDGSIYPLDEVRQIVVTLRSGYDGTPFLVDGKPVTDNWQIRFENEEMCGMGGAGGGSNMGGMPSFGGDSATGGQDAMAGNGGAP